MPRRNEYNASGSLQDRMIEFGFNVNAEGVCAGASVAGLEIALREGNTKRFDQLVQFIKQTPDLQDRISQLQHKRATLATQHRFHKPSLPKPEEEEYFLFDAYALLNQIQIYQSPSLYHDLFERTLSQYDAHAVAAATYPDHPTENRKLVSHRNWSWCGIYTHHTFKAMLESIQSLAGDKPIAFTLTGQLFNGEKHNVTLVYQKGTWTLINIADMPSQSFTTLPRLTDILFGLFGKHDSNTATVAIAPFSLTNNADVTHQLLDQLKESDTFIQTHRVTTDFFKSHKQSDILMLAQLAMTHHQLDTLQDLIKSGLNVNATLPCGHSLCYLAAQYNNDDVLSMLVEAGADIDNACGGATPLFIAVERQHVNMVDRLLALGANPNTTTIHNTTPIAMAAYLGNVSIIKLLKNHGVDLAKTLEQGTPLDIAQSAGRHEAAAYINSSIHPVKAPVIHTAAPAKKSKPAKHSILGSLFSWLAPSKRPNERQRKQKKSRQSP